MQSPFQAFYPRQLGKLFYITRSHAVKAKGFVPLSRGRYEYEIESEGGPRRYLMPFAPDFQKDKKFKQSSFRGLIGESLMRIVIKEWLRKNKKSLGISDYYLQKRGTGDSSLFDTDKYSATFSSRHNLVIHSKKEHRNLWEYDGLLEYNTEENEEGVIICEAKTGSLLGFENPIENRKGIIKNVVKPIRDFYPDHCIDLLLMAPEDKIITNPNTRRARKYISNLYRVLNNEGIGLIPFILPESKGTISDVAKDMALLDNRIKKSEVPLEGDLSSNMRAIEVDGAIYLLDNSRIVKILEPTSRKSYREIYRA